MKPFLTSILLLVSLSVFSQTLEWFEFTECQDEEFTYSINDRIISQKFVDDLFVIEISVVTNCCAGEFGKIEVDGDILRLFSSAKQTEVKNKQGNVIEILYIECDCDCCFTFKYFISGLEKKEYKVFFNDRLIEESEHKYKLRPIKYDIVEGDTVNYIDHYGFKQGIHERKVNGRSFYSLNYVNDKAVSGFKYRKYYDSGNLQEEFLVKDDECYEVIEYYENGNVKSKCKVEYCWGDLTECIEYDEKGNLLKE